MNAGLDFFVCFTVLYGGSTVFFFKAARCTLLTALFGHLIGQELTDQMIPQRMHIYGLGAFNVSGQQWSMLLRPDSLTASTTLSLHRVVVADPLPHHRGLPLPAAAGIRVLSFPDIPGWALFSWAVRQARPAECVMEQFVLWACWSLVESHRVVSMLAGASAAPADSLLCIFGTGQSQFELQSFRTLCPLPCHALPTSTALEFKAVPGCRNRPVMLEQRFQIFLKLYLRVPFASVLVESLQTRCKKSHRKEADQRSGRKCKPPEPILKPTLETKGCALFRRGESRAPRQRAPSRKKPGVGYGHLGATYGRRAELVSQ